MEAYQPVSVDEIIVVEKVGLVHHVYIHQDTILLLSKWCYTRAIILEAYHSVSVDEIIDIEKVGPPVSYTSGNNTFVGKNDAIQKA